MNCSHGWRDLLKKILRDSQEKNRIANALGISTNTLARWISGESRPRLQNLRLLLDLLPEHRQHFIELLEYEFGSDFVEAVDADPIFHGIPSDFYARIIHVCCSSSPVSPLYVVCDLVAQQMLRQLDPNQAGLQISIMQCMRPAPRKKVRSLRVLMVRSTFPARSICDQTALFVGQESLNGYVASHGIPHGVESHQSGSFYYPTHWHSWAQSLLCFPILLADCVAGCLLVASALPDYFRLPSRQKLIQCYTDLITIGFAPDDFYPLQQMSLERMPHQKDQQALVESRQRRIAEIVTNLNVPLPQAEQLVLQQIEEELIQLAGAR